MQRSPSLTDCEPCGYVAEHGSWGDTIPDGTTHCRDCHVTFPGGQRWGHCARCHETFSGITSFDWHQKHDEDGDFTDGCFCTFASEHARMAEHANLPDEWVVSAKVRLHRRTTSWGDYWGRDAPEFLGEK